MLGFIGYLLVAFVVFFITYKKLSPALQRKIENGSSYNSKVEYIEFWYIVFIPLFWQITLPGLLLWKILDFIYNKLTKK